MERRRKRRRILFALASTAALLAVAVWSAYARDMRAAHARVTGRSTVVQSPYGPIEYAVLGEGPPVLAIHGSGGGFDQSLEMMGPLAERGYRLIAPSRFGYLRSGRPDNASPAVQADALAWLMRRLGEDQVTVVGGSAGALPALQFAIRHPDRTRAVVLVVPAAYAPDRRPNQSGMSPATERIVFTLLRSDFLFWAGIRLTPEALTRALLATEPAVVRAAGPGEQARVRAILQHILPVSRRVRGLEDDSRWAGAPPRYPVERITAPLLAVSVRDDLFGTFAAARHAATTAPNGRFVGFPSGGHVWVGREQALWDAVAGFIAGVAAEPARAAPTPPAGR